MWHACAPIVAQVGLLEQQVVNSEEEGRTLLGRLHSSEPVALRTRHPSDCNLTVQIAT